MRRGVRYGSLGPGEYGVSYGRGLVFFFQAEDGIRDYKVTGVQTCALPISFAVRVTPLAPQVARVEVPGADAPIVIGLLPFLSEAKVAREGDGAHLASIGGDRKSVG